MKNVEAVIPPNTPHFVGDGFRVHGFIPGKHPLSMKRMSPFLLLDYNAKVNFPPSETPRGVGVHPHRGFETVTIAYKGKVAHHDSSGGGGVISEGDVQWMTAASGILHKEFHEEGYSKKGGDFQMVQLWVNLPAKDKMSEPKYQAIKNEEMTKLELENNAGTLEVIAGKYENTKGTASTFTPINLFNLYLKKDRDISFKFAEIDNCLPFHFLHNHSWKQTCFFSRASWFNCYNQNTDSRLYTELLCSFNGKFFHNHS